MIISFLIIVTLQQVGVTNESDSKREGEDIQAVKNEPSSVAAVDNKTTEVVESDSEGEGEDIQTVRSKPKDNRLKQQWKGARRSLKEVLHQICFKSATTFQEALPWAKFV